MHQGSTNVAQLDSEQLNSKCSPQGQVKIAFDWQKRYGLFQYILLQCELVRLQRNFSQAPGNSVLPDSLALRLRRLDAMVAFALHTSSLTASKAALAGKSVRSANSAPRQVLERF